RETAGLSPQSRASAAARRPMDRPPSFSHREQKTFEITNIFRLLEWNLESFRNFLDLCPPRSSYPSGRGKGAYMEQASDAMVATQAALAQVSALAIQYSFSILGALVLLVIGWIAASLLSRWAYRGLAR